MIHLYFTELKAFDAFLHQFALFFDRASIFVLNSKKQIFWQSTSIQECNAAFIQTILAEDELIYEKKEVFIEHMNTFLMMHWVTVKNDVFRLYLFQPCPIQFNKASYFQRETTPIEEQLAARFNSQMPKMFDMFHIIERVATTPFPVLVRGESGSGKEWVAKAIHDYSDRQQQPFIAINCASLNANILESELFGHVKGAFTGAIRDHKGVFERAHGGTLLLDEIAEIPLDLQAGLLRIIETGELTRVGGEKTIKINVRLIAATHKALREEVKHGRFRQDLLYRLRVIPIFVPSLRERKPDIPLLVKKIIETYAVSEQVHPEISPAALNVLMHYDWPGNIRELKNTLQYALIMAKDKHCIEVRDLPVEITAVSEKEIIVDELVMPLNRETLLQMLSIHAHNLQKVCEIFGISRTTLWRYRKKWHI